MSIFEGGLEGEPLVDGEVGWTGVWADSLLGENSNNLFAGMSENGRESGGKFLARTAKSALDEGEIGFGGERLRAGCEDNDLGIDFRGRSEEVALNDGTKFDFGVGLSSDREDGVVALFGGDALGDFFLD